MDPDGLHDMPAPDPDPFLVTDRPPQPPPDDPQNFFHTNHTHGQKVALFCPQWLFDRNWSNRTTLSDINTEFMRRNIPGIYFISLQMLLSLVGNISVLLLYRNRSKTSNYRVYVLFLVLLDLISCVFVMPFAILYLYYPLQFPSNVVCKAGYFLGFFVHIASPLILVLIAIDRFQKVCRPLQKQLTEQQSKLSCLFVCVFALGFSWFTPLLYGNSKINTQINNIEGTRCFLESDRLTMRIAKWNYIALTVMLVIVTAFLCILYSLILRRIHSHSKYSTVRTKTRQKGQPKPQKLGKTTTTFLIISVVYLINALIHDALALVLHVQPNLECSMGFYGGALYYIFLWTIFLNNVSNPFIYGLSDDRFSTMFKGFFQRNGPGALRSSFTRNFNTSTSSVTKDSLQQSSSKKQTSPSSARKSDEK
uniref:Cholecystokinin receptor type A n=1 Tax=Magallana gigas TaxID=29159 RepID=K1PNH4_MAGGI|eukprot:XP_011453330.1 PREDICTED: trace amine-associated receptor 4 [Crassostrea gigas]